jgi:hypothetical protein
MLNAVSRALARQGFCADELLKLEGTFFCAVFREHALLSTPPNNARLFSGEIR